MIAARKAGLALAALFSAVLVVPVLADGAADFVADSQKAQTDVDSIAKLIDNIHNRTASNATPDATQQVADTEDTMKCPACGMTMTSKATASNTRMVTIKGKNYYCCAGCNMSKITDKPARGNRARNGARRNRNQNNNNKKNP
jgi:YHS domain-containing protein